MQLPNVGATISTALLDVDGTLLDSNDAHAHAWVDAFAEAGMNVSFERIRPLIGMGGDRLLPTISPDLSDEREPGKTIARRRGEIFRERYANELHPTPGARDLVEALSRAGVTCVAATSAKKDELEMLLERAAVADLIRTRSSADDADSSKPAPDIVHAALQRAHSDARSSVMLGDTRYDIDAARRAGVPAIALRCGGSSDEELAGAVAIYDDPRSLVAALRA